MTPEEKASEHTDAQQIAPGSHAEDSVHICREVFGAGNDFCKKITYQAKHPATGKPVKGRDLIKVQRPLRPTTIRRRRTRSDGEADTFCNSPIPRIALDEQESNFSTWELARTTPDTWFKCTVNKGLRVVLGS